MSIQMKHTATFDENNVTTLYEALHFCGGGTDICDSDWDLCVYFETSETEEPDEDAYDRFMRVIALNLLIDEPERYVPADGYPSCRIADFMWENRDIFEPFFNENNRDGYRPEDYDELSPSFDSGFYEAYMMPFESLVVGNYTEEDYDYLTKKFREKAQTEKKSEKS